MKTYSQFGQAELLLSFSNSIGLAQGIVVEAGAYTPKSVSDSMCFIEAGWRAILIEPCEVYFRQWHEMNRGNIEIHSTGIKDNQEGLQSLINDINAPKDIDIFFDIDSGDIRYLMV